MRYHTLANTECDVSEIGLGTVKFGRNADVKYPMDFQLPDDRTLSRILAITRDQGVTLLDTAPAYGISEQRLGGLLKGQRHHWVISTKVGEYYKDGRSTFDFSAAAVRRSVENSLRDLATDYLDIVLIHSDGRDLDILRGQDTLSELNLLKKEGKIRCVGMSSKTLAGGLAALDASDLAMITYNRNQVAEEPILDRAQAIHKGVLIKKALNSGHLASDASSATWLRDSLDFVFAHPAVSSVVIGSINPDHWLDTLNTYQAIRDI